MEKSIVFIHIFAYCILYSFLLFQDSFLYNFTCVYRASFRHYFRIGLPVTTFLSFPSTENVSISPLLVKASGLMALLFLKLKYIGLFPSGS